MKEQNERSETYQAIISEIQMEKAKLKDLESRSNTMQRQLIMRAKEIGDLEMDKRGKERQYKNTTASLSISE